MIEVTLFNMVGLSIIGVLIAFWYQPIQAPKNWLIGKLPRFLYTPINTALNCGKCSSFILAIIFFHDMLAAAWCALLAFIISFIIEYINEWYE